VQLRPTVAQGARAPLAPAMRQSAGLARKRPPSRQTAAQLRKKVSAQRYLRIHNTTVNKLRLRETTAARKLDTANRAMVMRLSMLQTIFGFILGTILVSATNIPAANEPREDA
jgi:hypothetical protein